MTEKTIYAVIDTNVLVSAMISHNPNSLTIKVLKALSDGSITPLYNDEIFNEYAEVLYRHKFNLDYDDVTNMLRHIKNIGLEAERIKSDELFSDTSDAVFYEVALSKAGSFLVTGNLRHFPKSPIVVTPAEILEILDSFIKL